MRSLATGVCRGFRRGKATASIVPADGCIRGIAAGALRWLFVVGCHLSTTVDENHPLSFDVERMIKQENGARPMTCPKCASEEWKLASIVHAGGLSAISTSTIGVGGGANADVFGGGLGLGAGVGSTRGKQQTELSKLAEPPAKELRPAKALAILGGITLVIGILFADTRSVPMSIYWLTAPWLVIMGVIGIVRLLFYPEITTAINERHKLALLEYEKKKMCLRCGAFYFDDDNPSVLESKVSGATESGQLVSSTKKCPFCAEAILAAAVLCKHCHSKIQ